MIYELKLYIISSFIYTMIKYATIGLKYSTIIDPSYVLSTYRYMKWSMNWSSTSSANAYAPSSNIPSLVINKVTSSIYRMSQVNNHIWHDLWAEALHHQLIHIHYHQIFYHQLKVQHHHQAIVRHKWLIIYEPKLYIIS